MLATFPSFTSRLLPGSLLLVFPTLLSPFSAIVLPVAGGDESCTGEDLRGLAQLRNRCLQGLDALAFCLPCCSLLFSPPALFGVHLCSELSEQTTAHILPYHPAVHLTTAGVVESSTLSFLPGTHNISHCCVAFSRLPRFTGQLPSSDPRDAFQVPVR